MKVSKLIEKFQKLHEKYGDIDLVKWDKYYDDCVVYNEDDLESISAGNYSKKTLFFIEMDDPLYDKEKLDINAICIN